MTIAMRVLSGVTKLVGGLLAVVLVVYLAVNLTSLAPGWQQRGELADDFAAQAEPLLPDLRERQSALGDEAGHPDRAWIEQVCAFDSDDSGWMVNNYRERCSLRSVTAWQVESAGAGRDLLEVTPPDHTADGPGCEELGTLGGGSTRPGTAEVRTQGVSLALAGRAADSVCGDWTSYGSRTRTVEGGDEPLPLDATWVVVVESTGDLIDEDIGCAHWSVLFCDNPFTDHAWADLG